MKYFVGLLLGMIVGVAIFGAAIYWNPFVGRSSVSPLALSTDMVELTFSEVPEKSIAWIDNGDSAWPPHPQKVQELWEPAIADTVVLVTRLNDSRGQPAGFGIKFSTGAESARLMNGEVLVNSVWHVWLSGQGGLLIEQTENEWPWLRDVVIPARWSTSNHWRGTWFGILTVGPSALGSGRVTAGSGRFSGAEGEAVEARRASAYSATSGPAAVDGSLTVVLSDRSAADEVMPQ
ncbi:MAG: hypothetical protein WD078_11835 [Woeseia sp.]